MKSILLIKMFLGLVEMTFGLVYASFSFPEWQALKMTFFAPCVPWCRTKKLSLLIKITTTTTTTTVQSGHGFHISWYSFPPQAQHYH